MNGIEAALRAPGGWLALAVLAIVGLAMLAYVIRDGYDVSVVAPRTWAAIERWM